MKKGILIDVSDKIDSINTFESYSYECYLNDNTLLIPYIKLELIDQDVIGNLEQRVNIDFSYLVFNGLKEINWIGKNSRKERIVGGKQLAEKKKTDLTNWVAVNRNEEGYEIKAIFERLLIFVPLDASTGKECRTHKYTPNFLQNINLKIAQIFFELRNFPAELKKILELETFSKLSFENGHDKEIKLIENKWTE